MQATVPRVFATVVATDTSDVAKLSFRGPHNLGFCSLHPIFILFSGGRTILEAQFFVISPSFFRRKYLSMLRWQNIIVYTVPDFNLSRKTRNFFRTFTTRQIKRKIFLIYFFFGFKTTFIVPLFLNAWVVVIWIKQNLFKMCLSALNVTVCLSVQ